MPDWHVYVLRTASGSLYTGIATDVDARCARHAAGRGAKSLRGRGPLSLVLRARIGDVGLALRVEHGLKRLTKSAKEDLVASRPTRARVLRAAGCAPPRGSARNQSDERASARRTDGAAPGRSRLGTEADRPEPRPRTRRRGGAQTVKESGPRRPRSA